MSCSFLLSQRIELASSVIFLKVANDLKIFENPDKKPAEKFSLNGDDNSLMEKIITVFLSVKCFWH